MYYYCRDFPQKAHDALEKKSAQQLPRSTAVKPHLSPKYNPRNSDFASLQELQPDIIVGAPGLQLQFAGGLDISVSGNTIDVTKEVMLQDSPNLNSILGFVNASWTLSAQMMLMLLVRLWQHMRPRGARVAVPRLEKPSPASTALLPLVTCFQNASNVFSDGGSTQWSRKKNHIVDGWRSKTGDVSNCLIST